MSVNTEWESKFSTAIRNGNTWAALQILEQRSTSHAGTPPSAVKRKAVELLTANIHENKLEQWAVEMANASSPTAKEIACSLLSNYYLRRPALVHKLMLRLADDTNWEVRESAAQLFGLILADHFNQVYPQVRKLVTHKSPNVRRAVAVAVKYAAKKRNPDWGLPLLRLIEPLLSDPHEYVRKNLGPFAIGDGLLRCYPCLTLTKLKKWVKSKDAIVRWNIAMCLSTAEARKHLNEALQILDDLAADDRRLVWRAVATAAKNHARLVPEKVLPVVRKWLKDPKKKQAAEVVFKYIT